MSLALTILFLIFLFIIHIPIAFALGIAATAYMLISDIDLIIVSQQVANGPDSWILLAMPLFVTVGLLMNTTGIAHRLIRFADALVGHLRGGLALVNVIASMIFGGISGSAVADTAALGSILIPAMEKEGYEKSFIAALTSSSASIGIIIPPSITMIVYGAVSRTPLGTLFIAGMIPGILVGISQMIVAFILAKKNNWGIRTPFLLSKLIKTAMSAFLGLIMPVIVIGGIVSGVFTPTEAGAIGIVYGILISLFFYKSITFKNLYRVLVDSAVLTSVVMIVIATSYTLSWMLSHQQIPQIAAEIFLNLSNNPSIILILTSFVLIIAGCLLHGDPMVLIVVPLVLPSVLNMGIDLIHFGMLVVFCCAIGQQTPPVGSTLFVVSAISGVDMMKITKSNLPFIGLFILLLSLLIFVPEIVMFLPNAVFPTK